MLSFPLVDGIELRLWMHHHTTALADAVRRNTGHLRAFLPFATEQYSEADAHDYIERSLKKLSQNEAMHFGIFHGDQVIGSIGSEDWDWRAKSTEIGYWLAEDWQGRGIMTRAVQVLTDYVIGTLGLNRIEILMDVANERSAAVPQRLGYSYEGVRREYLKFDDSYHDAHVYYMLAQDWGDPHTPGFRNGAGLLRFELGESSHLELLMPYHIAAYGQRIQEDQAYLSQWLPWDDTDYDEARAEWMTTEFLKKLAQRNGMAFAIIHEGDFAGSIGYLYWLWEKDMTELGYWLGEKFQGQGLMTRSVAALTDFAINTLNLNRVEIRTDPENIASCKVAERAGYYREGIRRQVFQRQGIALDSVVYVMLASLWGQSQSKPKTDR
jgi:ribosomal-protein-serine acetyltransferase